jgi:hypothetical protein
VATLLWSAAGVVTTSSRRADSGDVLAQRLQRGRARRLLAPVVAALEDLAQRRPTLWLGPLLGGDVPAFMVAITMTTVANVLVTMAIAPSHALVARVVLGQRCT